MLYVVKSVNKILKQMQLTKALVNTKDIFLITA